MAVAYNLISCDDVLYPSLYNQYNPTLSAYLGDIVSFVGIEGSYLVARSNQCVFPYPYEITALSSVTVTVSEILVNGVNIVSTPLTYTLSQSAYPLTDTLSSGAIPSLFPGDYTWNQNNPTIYTPGTTIPRYFSDFIQNILSSSGVQNIFIRSSRDSNASIGDSERFKNFVIHKHESDSLVLDLQIEVTPNIGPIVTEDHLISFVGQTATYTINTIPVVPEVGTVVQDYVTVEKPIFLFDFSEEVILDTLLECPCELCDNCFKLTNCETDDTLTVMTDMTEYLNQVVTLEGYDGCWTVSNCDPIIEVEVTDSFVTCKSCLPNCNTPTC